MRMSRACSLTAWQRVFQTLERFDDLTENDKTELFKNSIQAYVEYLEELKEKRKKLAMKIISYARSTYKSRLVKF
jgi:phage terminase small subunit